MNHAVKVFGYPEIPGSFVAVCECGWSNSSSATAAEADFAGQRHVQEMAPQVAQGNARFITQDQLDNWFMYHAPKGSEQVAQYQAIREAGKQFAQVIVATTPPSADQTAAIRKVREAVFTANAAIACDGK